MKALRNFDLFRKPLKDHIEQTFSGGLITLLSMSLMFGLFLSETQSFLTHTVKKETIIDQSLESSTVQINIDVFLPHVPCVPISLDHQDDVNKHIMDYSETLEKVRVSRTGEVIQDGFQRNLNELVKAIDDGEGCQIRGFIKVAKVPGNFHISLHVGHELLHSLPRDYMLRLKFDHVVNHLSIGSEDISQIVEEDFGVDKISRYSGLNVSDLEGVSKHEYFLKVIPVQFVNECNAARVNTYTYSLNRNSDLFYSAFGAIYFRYSFEDLTMRYTKTDKKFGRYLVSLCAILGGVFTVLGLFNKVVN
jgi:hypothetical protein